jgi:hypothetical protein
MTAILVDDARENALWRSAKRRGSLAMSLHHFANRDKYLNRPPPNVCARCSTLLAFMNVLNMSLKRKTADALAVQAKRSKPDA